MNLSCTTRAIKYLMFAFNFLFVITGIILIAVGASIHRHYNDYEYFLDAKYFSLPNLLIATGIMIFIISFLGCYGALKESWLMLMAFSVLLGVIFIFEFSAGIAGYVLRDKTSAYLESTFYDTIPQYNDSSIAFMWDNIQRQFRCCGVFGPEDWVEKFNQNASHSLPVSCCPEVSGTMGQFICNNYPHSTTAPPTTTDSNATASSGPPTVSPVTTSEPSSPTTSPQSVTTPTTSQPANKKIRRAAGGELVEANSTSTEPPKSTSTPYSTGCEAAFGSWVKEHAVNIGAVGFALAVIQILGIGFACHLSRQLKNRYYST